MSWQLPGMEACGVKPQLCLLPNGVVACSSSWLGSRPGIGDQILFSDDDEQTCSDPALIFHGPWTGYTSMLETSRNELRYLYDDQAFGWLESRMNRSVVVNVKVQKA